MRFPNAQNNFSNSTSTIYIHIYRGTRNFWHRLGLQPLHELRAFSFFFFFRWCPPLPSRSAGVARINGAWSNAFAKVSHFGANNFEFNKVSNAYTRTRRRDSSKPSTLSHTFKQPRRGTLMSARGNACKRRWYGRRGWGEWRWRRRR